MSLGVQRVRGKSDACLSYSVREAAAELLETTRAAQALPKRVCDPVVMARLAQLLQEHEPAR